MDWRKELNSILRRHTASVAGRRDYSYAWPSRRAGTVPDVVLPAMRAPHPPRAVIGIDTSGSMTEELLVQCLAEIRGIIRRTSSRSGESVRVITCDAAASEAQVVKGIHDVQLIGGGGTDMRVGITKAARARPRADVIITLTDGETPWQRRAPQANPQAKYIAVLVDGQVDPGDQPPTWMHPIVIDTRW